MLSPTAALLLVALAGPGATAVPAAAAPPAALATIEAVDELLSGLRASQLETREEIDALRVEVKQLAKKSGAQQAQIDSCGKAGAEGGEGGKGNASHLESRGEIDALRAEVKQLAEKSGEQQAQIDSCGKAGAEGGEGRRSMQSQGPADEAVRIWRRDEAALQPTGGHRRVLAEGDCDPASKGGKLAIATITRECCDEPSEDCAGGVLRTCNEGCSAILLPFWQTCERGLAKAVRKELQTAAGLCPAPPTPAPSSAVAMLYVTCPPGVLSDDTCIPTCDARTNGGVLLVNQAGTDLRLLCEMQNFLFSVRGTPRTHPAAFARSCRGVPR